MAKFIVTVEVFIDGSTPKIITVGSMSGSSKDYNINEVKDTVTGHFKRVHSNKKIAVKIHSARLASDLEFEEARKTFLN